jgi:hypothetical protein
MKIAILCTMALILTGCAGNSAVSCHRLIGHKKPHHYIVYDTCKNTIGFLDYMPYVTEFEKQQLDQMELKEGGSL